ncbi:hypothetical protein B7494_g6992 [Chlorociboria aeruginascens]|nr:hypothetical protein B7494_g6992 [Chlorociboria aeruginascens]
MFSKTHPIKTLLLTTTSPRTIRQIHGTLPNRKWEGRPAADSTVRESDSHNAQQDAVKEGKSERAKGEGGQATSEKSSGGNEKAKKDNPEAPWPVIGMNDERGGKPATPVAMLITHPERQIMWIEFQARPTLNDKT